MPKPDCSPLAKLLARLALNIGSRPEVASLDHVVTELKKHIPEIDRKTVVDAINEYTAQGPKNLTELQKKLADLKREARNDTALRGAIDEYQKAARAGTVPEKAERNTAAPEAIQKLRDERDALKKQVAQNDPALRDKVKARIAELENHIKAGTVPAKTERPPAPADLQALRDQRDALRAQVAQADPAKQEAIQKRIDELQTHLDAGTLPAKSASAGLAPSDKVVALRSQRDQLLSALRQSEPALRERFEKQIADLTDKLQGGVTLPEAPPERVLSKELETLRYQRDRLRQQVNQRIDSLKPRTFWQKAGTAVSEPLNLARSVLVSFNLSAMRHGAITSFSHPIRAAKAIPAGLQAFASAARAHAINESILNRPNAPLYDKAGLYLAPVEGTKLSGQEEQFMSRLGHKIPFVAGSERSYNVYMNKVRADSFDAMVETLSKNGTPTNEEAKAIANYVNVATGRGLHGKFEQAAPALNSIFFAPRYVASRFEYLLGQPLAGGTARTRLLIAGEYAKTLTGMAVMYGLAKAAGADVELDPRSSEFGKIKFGNTLIDPLGGLAQAAVYMARMVTGQTKTGSGRVVDTGGLNTSLQPNANAWDITSRFVRSKLSPPVSAAANIASGQDMVGNKATIGTELAHMFTPLPFRDTYLEMKEHGVPAATATGLLSFLAFGIEHRAQAPPADQMKQYADQITKAAAQSPHGLNSAGIDTLSMIVKRLDPAAKDRMGTIRTLIAGLSPDEQKKVLHSVQQHPGRFLIAADQAAPSPDH